MLLNTARQIKVKILMLSVRLLWLRAALNECWLHCGVVVIIAYLLSSQNLRFFALRKPELVSAFCNQKELN